MCGVQVPNADAEILRLENMMRDGIEPRIPGVSTRVVPMEASSAVIVIRVPRSWASPHRVTLAGHGHFYSRNSAGKYRLDVSELRAAFTQSETVVEQIRSFRIGRLSIIVAGEAPVILEEGAKMILHIVPFNAFDPSIRLDIVALGTDPKRSRLMRDSGRRLRYNLDGVCYESSSLRPGTAGNYLQVFRNGSIEAIETDLVSVENRGDHVIASVVYEQKLLEEIPRFISIQKEIGVEPPLSIMLSMLGVHGCTLAVSSNLRRTVRSEAHPIDRKDLLLPEVIAQEMDFDPAEVMKPIFDSVWNSAGYSRSLNYSEEGKWGAGPNRR